MAWGDDFRGTESMSPVSSSSSLPQLDYSSLLSKQMMLNRYGNTPGSSPATSSPVTQPLNINIGNGMGLNNVTPSLQDQYINKINQKLDIENQINQGKLDWQNSGWGKFSQGVDIANGAMNVLNTGFSLYSNIADYSTKRAMNKEKLENARLTNQALREDMQNRRNEIARLGKMRSNAAAQQASGSINTRG